MMDDPWKCPSGLWTRWSGGVDYLNLKLEDVDPEDIADSLSRQCRWNGHVPISVAEHCVNLYDQVGPDLKIHALLHDSAEAYLGDVPTPIKKGLWLYGQPFHEIELRILRTIYEKFNVEYDPVALDEILNVERSVLHLELQLDPSRSLASDHWRKRWLRLASAPRDQQAAGSDKI